MTRPRSVMGGKGRERVMWCFVRGTEVVMLMMPCDATGLCRVGKETWSVGSCYKPLRPRSIMEGRERTTVVLKGLK